MMVVFTFHELDATYKAITFWLEFARSEHRNSLYVVPDSAPGVLGKMWSAKIVSEQFRK